MSIEQKNNDLSSKIKFSDQDIKNFCCEWEASSLSKTKFCKMRGIPIGVFYAWYRRYKNRTEAKATFAPVTLSSAPLIERENKMQIEIRLQNHAQLFINMRESRLIPFIQELCHAITVIR